MIKKLIYTIQMNLADASSLNIMIATNDKTKLPSLVDKNKMWVEKAMKEKVVGWKFISEDLSVLKMSLTDYEEAISRCDFVDENDEISTPDYNEGQTNPSINTSGYFNLSGVSDLMR